MAARMSANAPAGVEAHKYWEAASAVLSWPGAPPRAPRPGSLRAQLRALVRANAERTDNRSALLAISGGQAPADLFESTASFAEAIAYVRCIREVRDGTSEVESMRAYVRQAVVPASMPALYVDRAAAQERLSFIVLLMEGNRLADMRAMFNAFRSVYAVSYAKHHERYWKKAGEITRAIESLAPAAAALERLNTLEPLGAPLGTTAIAAYGRLQDAEPCTEAVESGHLEQEPLCASCSVTLAGEPPEEQFATVEREISAAIAAQQRRLASAAVQRIVGRGGTRLDRFVELVQAADTAALALILDDQLITFLRELLTEPVTPPSFLAKTR